MTCSAGNDHLMIVSVFVTNCAIVLGWLWRASGISVRRAPKEGK